MEIMNINDMDSILLMSEVNVAESNAYDWPGSTNFVGQFAIFDHKLLGTH